MKITENAASCIKLSAYVFVIEQICSNFAPVFAQPLPRLRDKRRETRLRGGMELIRNAMNARHADANDIRTIYLTITQKL